MHGRSRGKGETPRPCRFESVRRRVPVVPDISGQQNNFSFSRQEKDDMRRRMCPYAQFIKSRHVFILLELANMRVLHGCGEVDTE